jgi:hypothetical protein
MNWSLFIEWFGIFASILVAVSITMRNIKWLRILNLTGSLTFAVYGICIYSWPVMLLNVFTVGINIYYLFKLKRDSQKPETFEALFVDPTSDSYVRRFILFYGEDISRFFPSFDPNPETGTLAGAECCFILRETLPVSLVAFRRGPGEEIAILLDYAIPLYRDFKSARFFFETVSSRIAIPGAVFITAGEVPAHVHYLRRMGFSETGKTDKAVLFQKEIGEPR